MERENRSKRNIYKLMDGQLESTHGKNGNMLYIPYQPFSILHRA